MNRDEAEGMAMSLLMKHAPRHYATGWRFGGFTRATKTYGMCKYATRTIVLSGPYVDHADRAHVEQTILHEIAHVIAGGKAGHGPDWLAKARAIGYTGGRTTTAQIPAAVLKPKWVGKCDHGCSVNYQRKPGDRMLYGARCRKHSKSITWTETATGRTVKAATARPTVRKPATQQEQMDYFTRKLAKALNA